MHWKIIIKKFGYDIQHKAGVDNIVADTLSRLPSTPIDKHKSSTIKDHCRAKELFTMGSVNYRALTTVRHGSYFHRIWPNPQSHPRRPSVVRRRNYWLDSQTSVLQLTLKLLSRLSFDRHRNYWLTSQPSFLRPSQLLMTHVPDVCTPTVTENKYCHLSAPSKTRIAIKSSLSY